MSLNHVALIGNLTRDPEIKVVKSGGKDVSVVKFTLAENRSFKKKDGTWDEQTNWIRCEAWDSGANAIAEKFTKGDQMLVEGSLRTNTWEDTATGKQRTDVTVRVEKFSKIHRAPKKEGAEVSNEGSPEPEPEPAADKKVSSDIPF